jgi:hypothetical protein
MSTEVWPDREPEPGAARLAALEQQLYARMAAATAVLREPRQAARRLPPRPTAGDAPAH